MSKFQPFPHQSDVTEEPTQSQHQAFVVRFWGVRGLVPTPTSNTRRYGGNTVCVEIQVNGKRLIFDGGTGLRILGQSWLELHRPIEAHLFFTNSQSNRIQGFPFFAPAFLPENCFHVYGTAASNGASIKQSLCDQMLQPHFPYPLQVMQSELQFHNLTPGMVVKLDDVKITPALINRPQKSIGYRVIWQEYSIAYVTDLHKNADESDRESIAQLTKGVDLLIANTTYTPLTRHNHRESNLYWQTAVDLAYTNAVKQLVIFYHKPDDHDDFLDQMQIEVKSVFPKAILAHEGLILSVVQ